MAMAAATISLASCGQGQEKTTGEDDFKWIVDSFDDVKVLQYRVPGFEDLSLQQKTLIYYLNQAALCGRDIVFDQNFKYNLPIRRTLEAVYVNYGGDRGSEEWASFEKYLKKVWFANGIHHHYSNDKFTPEFSEAYFDTLIAAIPAESLPLDFGTAEEILAVVKPAIFDPALYPVRLNQAAGQDLLKTSAMNFYEGLTQAEAEKFYTDMAAAHKGDPRPVSYGLNSKLVKASGAKSPHEEVWKVGGMYSQALEKVVYWLEKAISVANAPRYYREAHGILPHGRPSQVRRVQCPLGAGN